MFFRKRQDEKTKQYKITNMFKKSTQSIEDGQLAYYYLSLIVAKQELSHTIREKRFIPVLKQFCKNSFILKTPVIF